MRRASSALLLLVSLVWGVSAVAAPAASAAVDGCGFVGTLVGPAEDDCRAVVAFVDGARDRLADDVHFVFCTIFPDHSSCP